MDQSVLGEGSGNRDDAAHEPMPSNKLMELVVSNNPFNLMVFSVLAHLV